MICFSLSQLEMAEGLPIKSVWGQKPRTASEDDDRPIVSFAEIMSEELAEEMQQFELDEEAKEQAEIERVLKEAGIDFGSSTSKDPDTSRDLELALELSADPDCSADEVLARQLQREFDREQELQHMLETSKQKTGVAKAVIGADPYHYLEEDNEEEDSGEEDDDFREMATNMLYDYCKPEFPPCGFKKSENGSVITKHDRNIAAAQNCEKTLNFPLDVNTGDVVGEKINNKVFNHLKTHLKAQSNRQVRLKDKDEKASSENSVDGQTRLILFKWINTQDIDRVDEVIATGKESAVLHASKGEGTPTPEHFAVKVYKMSLDAFKNRSEYVKDDFRFKNPRRVMKVWAEKEFLNLRRLYRAKLPCPKPLMLKKHVLLMSMIGDNEAAPRLKNVIWCDQETKKLAFDQVRDIMLKMFKVCKLVHGDLSEFNLLYHNGEVFVIDVAQAVDSSHPRSLVFLVRDIENVLSFFHRIDTEEVNLPTATALFNDITGISMNEHENLMVQVEAFETENRNMLLKADKHRPADLELRNYLAEKKGRPDSPAEPFN
uniref:Serine/threonine-protein kinase RIO3 n=1 Tax=Panagrolaimus sp. JU765 TaxID=591449 RepID=A0AC34Q5C1_9BILA